MKDIPYTLEPIEERVAWCEAQLEHHDDRIEKLEQRVTFLSLQLQSTAKSALQMVDVMENLLARIAALETGNVYLANPTVGVPGGTAGAPLVRHYATISGGDFAVAQDGGQPLAR